MQLSENSDSERALPTDRLTVTTQRDEDLPMGMARGGPSRVVTGTSDDISTSTNNRVPSLDGLNTIRAAPDEEDKLGISDLIQLQLDILVSSWPEVRRVYGRRTPPDAQATVQALMQVLDTARSTLGLEPQAFYTRFATTTIPHDPAPEDNTAIPITPSSQGVNLTWPGKDTPDDGAPHPQKESDTVVTQTDSSLDDPIIARTESKSGFSLEELQYRIRVETTATKERLTYISSGPPWGTVDESFTCALDCCAVAGVLLGISQYDVELDGDINDDDVPIFYPPVQWDSYDVKAARLIKDEPYRRMLRYLNKDRPGAALTHASPLPIGVVFHRLFKNAPQFRLRVKWEYDCTKCGLATRSIDQLTVEPGAGKSNLPAFFEGMFEMNKTVSCKGCSSRTTRYQVWEHEPPLNLCVVPPDGENFDGITETPLAINWVGEDGRYMRLTYRWIGAVYNRAGHFLLHWRCNEDTVLTYDGLVLNGKFRKFRASTPEYLLTRGLDGKTSLLFFQLAEGSYTYRPGESRVQDCLKGNSKFPGVVETSEVEIETAKVQRKIQTPSSTSTTDGIVAAVEVHGNAAQPEHQPEEEREASVQVMCIRKGKGAADGEGGLPGQEREASVQVVVGNPKGKGVADRGSGSPGQGMEVQVMAVRKKRKGGEGEYRRRSKRLCRQ
ncbi:hypothetical protein GP486_006899 [Trichoglossum hirsutum]|uniref:Uncharacterized protein n=1 Tax=Trichoglossum hirsutum TaxID=265104 RepID=A0A9P8IDP9_9PEZI|nr:hypothetical protein GP486_006899 [Trichoglossum hirsutum]